MKRIYKGKTKLRVQIDTKCDLSGYEEVNVITKKPDDTTKTFPAIVKDVENGLIFLIFRKRQTLTFPAGGLYGRKFALMMTGLLVDVRPDSLFTSQAAYETD